MTSDAGHPVLARLVLCLAILLPPLFGGCSGDDDKPPPGGRDPRLVTVTTAVELVDALDGAVSGDTIEIEGGFSNPQFVMDRGFRLPAGTSPLLFRASPRSILRPEIVFPAGSDGLTFVGHRGTRLLNLALRGGLSTIVLDDSDVSLDTLTITDPAMDGVRITGSGSHGRVRGCLIEFVPVSRGGAGGRFGVSTGGGARPAIESNTIVEAGDCALYVGGNSLVRANNLYRAHNFGAFFDENSTAPTVSCNNAFQNANGNYVSAGTLPFDGNMQTDPRFCSGSYRLREVSPLAPANSGGCGLIGALPPDEGCAPPAAGGALPRY